MCKNLPYKQEVAGSSPALPTMFFNNLELLEMDAKVSFYPFVLPFANAARLAPPLSFSGALKTGREATGSSTFGPFQNLSLGGSVLSANRQSELQESRSLSHAMRGF